MIKVLNVLHSSQNLTQFIRAWSALKPTQASSLGITLRQVLGYLQTFDPSWHPKDRPPSESWDSFLVECFSQLIGWIKEEHLKKISNSDLSFILNELAKLVMMPRYQQVKLNSQLIHLILAHIVKNIVQVAAIDAAYCLWAFSKFLEGKHIIIDESSSQALYVLRQHIIINKTAIEAKGLAIAVLALIRIMERSEAVPFDKHMKADLEDMILFLAAQNPQDPTLQQSYANILFSIGRLTMLPIIETKDSSSATKYTLDNNMQTAFKIILQDLVLSLVRSFPNSNSFANHCYTLSQSSLGLARVVDSGQYELDKQTLDDLKKLLDLLVAMTKNREIAIAYDSSKSLIPLAQACGDLFWCYAKLIACKQINLAPDVETSLLTCFDTYISISEKLQSSSLSQWNAHFIFSVGKYLKFKALYLSLSRLEKIPYLFEKLVQSQHRMPTRLLIAALCGMEVCLQRLANVPQSSKHHKIYIPSSVLNALSNTIIEISNRKEFCWETFLSTLKILGRLTSATYQFNFSPEIKKTIDIILRKLENPPHEHMSMSDLAHGLWGLAKLYLNNIIELSPNNLALIDKLTARFRITPGYPSRYVTIFLWSTGILYAYQDISLEFTKMSGQLVKELTKETTKLNVEDINQLLIAIGLLKLPVKNESLHKLNNIVRPKSSLDNRSINKIKQLYGLSTLTTEERIEGFPVDVYGVNEQGGKVIIEINGPSHNRQNQINLDDFKIKLLKKRNYQVYSLTWAELNTANINPGVTQSPASFYFTPKTPLSSNPAQTTSMRKLTFT